MALGQHARRYPRVRAPIFYRAARVRVTYRLVVDAALGGMRIFSDEPLKTGRKLEVDLLLPDGEVVTCLAEVVWTSALPQGPAAYDVGLSFLRVQAGDAKRLAQVLACADEDEDAAVAAQ